MRIDSRRLIHAVCGLACVGLLGMLFARFPDATARDTGSPSPAEAAAGVMLDSLSGTTGLCVHLGFRDAALTTALTGDGKFLVHGLTPDADAVARVRDAIRSRNLEGLVSVEQGELQRLPYSDRLVNLIVAEDFAGLARQGLSVNEVLRVLAPEGTAWFGAAADAAGRKSLHDALQKAGVDAVEVVERGGVWIKAARPRPDGMDVWSHRRYDPSGTAVSKEEVLDVPSGIRWMAGPLWATGLRKNVVQAVTASERQLVYFYDDEVQTSAGPRRQHSLVARDAYNGLLLWKRPVVKPLPLLLVTLGDRIYASLDDDDDRLVSLDAATGETVQTYDISRRPSQILLHDGALIASVSSTVHCFDAATGRPTWSNDEAGADLLVGENRLFFTTSGRQPDGQRTTMLGAIDLATGKTLWQADVADFSPVFYQEGVIVGTGKGCTRAVSAKDGSPLWSYEYPLIGHGGNYAKILALEGLVWVHPAEVDGDKQYAWEGLDPRTGKVKRRLLQPKGFSMKHRCFSDRATARQILCGTMDFVDLKSGEYQHFAAARHSCGNGGVLPANGLLYTFPHSCQCYPMLRGFLGVATKGPEAEQPDASPAERLHTGPALGRVAAVRTAARAKAVPPDDWPTFRGNARRTGSTAATGPLRLTTLWERPLVAASRSLPAAEWEHKPGGRLSSPVVAGGLAFVASSDAQRIDALDAASGEPRWTYTADGRIDSPPTVDDGLCLFGSRDGQVHCVRAADGELVWRFRAAPTPERILAYGQLESLWPVVGGVLVQDGVAYVSAGRHSHADGGIHVYALRPETGQLLWHAQPDGFRGVADVLVGNSDAVHMISWQFDVRTGENGSSQSSDFLRAGRLGLVSDDWYRRPFALRKSAQDWKAGNESGQLLVFNQETLCGFKAGDDKQGSAFNSGSGRLEGAARLFAKPHGESDRRKDKTGWTLEFPEGTQITGMVLAGPKLFVAGRMNGNDPASHAVRAYAVSDGSLLQEHPLPAPPVHECLALAGERLYVSLQDGKLVCLGAR